jgi:hypothetical protein
VHKSFTAGLLTFDEARDRLPLGLSPLKAGGDNRLAPVNMALIKADGTTEPLIAPPAPAPAPAGPGGDNPANEKPPADR